MSTTTTELTLEQRVIRMAFACGSVDGPTAVQHLDVLKFHVEKAQFAADRYSEDNTSGRQIVAIRAFGQCLFDLIVQANFQGLSIDDCIPERNPFACTPPVWPLVDTYISGLESAVSTLAPGAPLTIQAIAQVYSCILAGSLTYLGITPERCLELTLGGFYD